MKKRIKKLFYSSFIAFISIAVNFDAEARLPKYMAQRAAELLIEKSGLQLKEEVGKEAFAAELVDFLYSTEKRQHLANWMKNRIERGQIKRNAVIDGGDTVQHFTNLFNDIHGGYVDDYSFRVFVNQHFPCWTGTMTCFILSRNNIAMKALSSGRVVEECLGGLDSENNFYKVVSILFTLELVDNWDNIRQVCKMRDEANNSPRLDPPSFENIDLYDCVPVPNTMYLLEASEKPQGSCMISTISNLLCILCKNGEGQFTSCDCLRNDVQNYIADLNVDAKGYFIAGTTSPEELKDFANIVLSFKPINRYQPTIALFVFALNELLKPDVRVKISDAQKRMLYDNIMSLTLLSDIFKQITGHDEELSVSFAALSEDEKKTKTWPEYKLEIIDEIVSKKIIIGLGKLGSGEHIEIINIEPLS